MDDEKCYCVYKHVNKVNGKVYVGITKNIVKRWEYDGLNYAKCIVFYNAIQKYGWDSFEHVVIVDGLTFDEACEQEIYYIGLYKSNCKKYTDPSYGYNMTDGGDGNGGYIFTDEDKKKKVDSFLSRSHDELISHYLKTKSTRLNRNIRSEPSKKCIDAAVASKIGKVGVNARPVYCITNDKYFRNCQEAADYYGIDRDQVKSMCRGTTHSVSCLEFRYATKVEAFDYFDISKRPVMCVEKNKIYDDAHDAALEIGISDAKLNNIKSQIIRCCKGYRNYSYGYHWRFVEKEEYIEWASVNYAKSNDIRKKELGKNRRRCHRGKPVICLNDGNYFGSIKDASVFYGSSVFAVTKSASEHRKTTSGLEFRYLTDDEIIRYGIDVGYRCKPVVCIETNTYYNSCVSVGDYSKYIYLGVYKCCNGKQKTSLGLHWRFATPDEIKEKCSERR